jgi:hypothetical protein
MKTKWIGGLLVVTTATATWLIVRNLPERSAVPASPMANATAPAAPSPVQKNRFVGQIEQIEDPGLHWEQRVQAVRSLPGKLGDASVDRLFEFLKQPPAAGQENWYLVCNEIMEVMRKRNLAPGLYTRKHLELIQSGASDPMIRDYAAQHLAQWISGIDANAREANPDVAMGAFGEMCAEATKPANAQLTLTGTTLNALTDAVLNGNEAMRGRKDEVARLALEVLQNRHAEASAVNRATALQAAARLDAPVLSGICRELAADTTAPVDVRLSSIAALGQIGGPEDLALLRTYAKDETFKFAAAAAVTRLEQAAASTPR